MKDNFSDKSEHYKLFRPEYPDELVSFICSQQRQRKAVWDCGTGNGQLAKKLAPYFEHVFATDISQQQLAAAEQIQNIEYSLQAAESKHFNHEQFDLITVAQAIHWFDFERFYAEVNRTLKKDGCIAVLGYGRLKINYELDKIIDRLYFDILGEYWDKERRYIDENYETIPFPFTEINCPSFAIRNTWNFAQLMGYLDTWSAVKHFSKKNNSSPLDIIRKDIQIAWKEENTKTVSFPILLRLGTK